MDKSCRFMSSFVEECYQSKAQIKEFKTIKVIMGHPNCDIDSAVSALVYAAFCHEQAKQAEETNTVIFPILNIMKEDLCMKTDVLFWMRCHCIPVDFLLTRTDLDLEELRKSHHLEVILVNHHVLSPADSSLQNCIVMIYDHHTPEIGFHYTGKKSIIPAGSCASLIARELIVHQPSLLTEDVCHFLYGPILLETSCLSPDSGRTSKLDLQVAKQFDKLLNYTVKREEIYQNLCDVPPYIAPTTAAELLFKDMEIICGVPVCSLPILIQEFVREPDVKEVLNEVCAQGKYPALMIMGCKTFQNTITRDLAVFSASEPAAAQQLIDRLKNCTKPVLRLQPVHSLIPGLSIFNQGNKQATKKEIVAFLSAVTKYIPPSRTCMR